MEVIHIILFNDMSKEGICQVVSQLSTLATLDRLVCVRRRYEIIKKEAAILYNLGVGSFIAQLVNVSCMNEPATDEPDFKLFGSVPG